MNKNPRICLAIGTLMGAVLFAGESSATDVYGAVTRQPLVMNNSARDSGLTTDSNNISSTARVGAWNYDKCSRQRPVCGDDYKEREANVLTLPIDLNGVTDIA